LIYGTKYALINRYFGLLILKPPLNQILTSPDQAFPLNEELLSAQLTKMNR